MSIGIGIRSYAYFLPVWKNNFDPCPTDSILIFFNFFSFKISNLADKISKWQLISTAPCACYSFYLNKFFTRVQIQINSSSGYYLRSEGCGSRFTLYLKNPYSDGFCKIQGIVIYLYSNIYLSIQLSASPNWNDPKANFRRLSDRCHSLENKWDWLILSTSNEMKLLW